MVEAFEDLKECPEKDEELTEEGKGKTAITEMAGGGVQQAQWRQWQLPR